MHNVLLLLSLLTFYLGLYINIFKVRLVCMFSICNILVVKNLILNGFLIVYHVDMPQINVTMIPLYRHLFCF